MLEITPDLHIHDSELQIEFVRASGPGGQNVNKVATAIKLYFNVRGSPSLPQDVKERLEKLAGSRLTADGVLVVDARRYRTQEKNRIDALQKLTALIQKALAKPKIRKATRPSLTAKAARVGTKKKRGDTKRLRHLSTEDWE